MKTMNTETAINLFHAQIQMYATVHEYLESGVTLRCDARKHGFDVYINGIAFYFVGDYAYDQIPTFAYCTIGIMREFYLESIKTAE